MKGKDIIEHIVRGEIPGMEQNIEQVKANCLNQEANENSIKNKFPRKTSKGRSIFSKPAATIALMICFVMLASATIAVIYQTQYIPGKGFVEGDYEVYYTPEILKFENLATVETVTRVKNGKSSELSIIITDMLDSAIKIITEKYGEFNLTPVTDYNYSSYGTLGKFQFNNESGYSSYGYFIENFPDINEFTLVSNGESAEVKLVPSNPEAVLTAENSGVAVKFYNMSKGSKVLAYEISENVFDAAKILSKPEIYKSAELGRPFMQEGFKLYDENGRRISLNGFDSYIGPNGTSQIMFLRITRDETISKIEVNNIEVRVYSNYSSRIYAGENIPIPKDGEELIFEEGLLLYENNGLVCKLKSVKRQGNGLFIRTDTQHTGEIDESISDICTEWTGVLGGMMSGWGFNGITINGDEDSIKVKMDILKYFVNGNWEIKFD